MPRPHRAAQPVGQPFDANEQRKARRVHGHDTGRIQQPAASLGEPGGIAGLIARIAIEVFGRPELLGVDEDRSHHLVGAFQPFGDQRQMASVERAHRRHKGHPRALPLPVRHGRRQRRRLTHDFKLRRQVRPLRLT